MSYIYLSSFGLVMDSGKETPEFYTPLSICSGISVAVKALQSLQVWATFCGMGSFLTWSGCTRNCRKKPADACHAMWQLLSCQQGLI